MGDRTLFRRHFCAMPTAAERQALAFLAGVALLGGSVQVWRGTAARRANEAAIAAEHGESVESQLLAVDSLRASRGRKKGARKPAKARGAGAAPRATKTTDAPLQIIDVDVASAVELELLPRVGPALAARIVADRDSLGQFGSLEELGRVRGIGPAMLKLLEPVTTFSGRVRARERIRYHW